MSAELEPQAVDLDLERNSVTLEIEELFNENDQLRLREGERGWEGFERDGDALFHVDTMP